MIIEESYTDSVKAKIFNNNTNEKLILFKKHNFIKVEQSKFQLSRLHLP